MMEWMVAWREREREMWLGVSDWSLSRGLEQMVLIHKSLDFFLTQTFILQR